MRYYRFAALTLLMACSDLSGLGTAKPYYNATLYPVLWDELTACSGIGGRLDAINFYTVEHLERNGVELAGHWNIGNTIYFEAAYRDDPLIVKHEMMHAKIQSSDHPAQYFNGACGDLMVHP